MNQRNFFIMFHLARLRCLLLTLRKYNYEDDWLFSKSTRFKATSGVKKDMDKEMALSYQNYSSCCPVAYMKLSRLTVSG